MGRDALTCDVFRTPCRVALALSALVSACEVRVSLGSNEGDAGALDVATFDSSATDDGAYDNSVDGTPAVFADAQQEIEATVEAGLDFGVDAAIDAGSCTPGTVCEGNRVCNQNRECVEDVDECLTNNGGCDGICTNTPGSFLCGARPTWHAVQTISQPPARRNHAMAYDPLRGRVVLFGGYGTRYLNDTWEWDGRTWNAMATTVAPEPRWAHTMVYDRQRRRIVLFGGWNGGAFLQDTWTWDGGQWTQLISAQTPSARDDHGMAYDIRRQRVVVFGGNAGVYQNDVWELSENGWSPLTPTTSIAPHARRTRVMAYNDDTGFTTLFGGSADTEYSDTWEWDGHAWNESHAGTAPPASSRHTLAYDSSRRRLVRMGGYRAGVRSADTWEWTRAGWTLVAPGNEALTARSDSAMVYDSGNQAMILFGGSRSDAFTDNFGDTWVLDAR